MALTYTEETTLRTVATRLAIEDLTARYSRALETGDLAGWLGTFLPEGTLQYGPDVISGHASLAAFFRATPRDRIQVTSEVQVAVDGVHAQQNCRFLVLKSGPDGAGVLIEAAGRFHDELVYERASWYFAKRLAVIDLPARA